MRARIMCSGAGGRCLAALTLIGALASSLPVSALEPLPPAAVDEWMGAFAGGHDSLRVLTTEEMMLALAKSERLEELAADFAALGTEQEVNTKRMRGLGLVNMALNRLVGNGYLAEAAKVDAATFAASAVLSGGGAALDSAARLTAAGDGEALLRLAETLLLTPGCHRNRQFDIKYEQGYTARTIEVPPVDNATLNRTTVLLPMLARAGVLKRFRDLAEKRVAAVPEDFKSLRVLTLVTLMDTGDAPGLWTRIDGAEGMFRGGKVRALKDAAHLCYQLRISAPHFCKAAEEIYGRSDVYGTSFRQFEFCLLLAALWKDCGEMDESRRMQEAVLVSLPNPGLGSGGRILEEWAGVVVDACGEEHFAPELDRWMVWFASALEERGDSQMFYRHALSACSWALASDLPRPMIERWFRLADQVLDVHFKRQEGAKRFNGALVRRHIFLLLDAGMAARAAEVHGRLTRAIAEAELKDFDPEEIAPWIEAVRQDREPIVLRRAGGRLLGSLRWQVGREYLRHSMDSAVEIADVFRVSADDAGAAGKPADKAGPAWRTLAGFGAAWEDGYFQLPDPEKPVPDWLAEKIEPSAGVARKPAARKLVLHPNLVPADWRLHEEYGLSSAMVPWDIKNGTIRLGRRGARSGGELLSLRSAPVDLEDGVDYMFSGRIRAFGRAGVRLQMLASDGSVLHKEKVTEHLDAASPGERWFRVILRRSDERKGGIHVAPETAAMRIVLTNSLSIQARWSDLCLYRLGPAGD